MENKPNGNADIDAWQAKLPPSTTLEALKQATAALAVISNQLGKTHPGLADADNLASVRGFALECFHEGRKAINAAEGHEQALAIERAINRDLLAALEGLDMALTPYLEALRTSHLTMNRVERGIYGAAIEARAAIAKAEGA